jgi:cold shock CspA family protein
MAESWNKKERAKKKQQERKEKAEKKLERKEQARNGNNLDTMLAYVDENGNISSQPPNPLRKIEVNAVDIQISVPKYVHEDEPLRQGVVSSFNESKGYGFIKDIKTGESIFVHVKSLSEPLKENNKVTFETEAGPKGLNAVNVNIVR